MVQVIICYHVNMFNLGSYKPSERVETDSYILRKLEVRDVIMDYAAFMSSIDAIKKQRGGTWPSPDFGLEENIVDLGWHQREFEFKTSFAYLVTTKDGKEELGCVYFYPAGHPMNSAKTDVPDGTDVVVNMWVTQVAFDRGFYDELYHYVEIWVKDEWPFQAPYFSNPLKPSN
jgi:hypothetical protein